MVRVMIPYQLQVLAHADPEVVLEVPSPVTVNSIIRTLETRYPMLRGAILDHATGKRRPLIRLFACNKDVSHDSPDTPLHEDIVLGKEPFIILGAIAGG